MYRKFVFIFIAVLSVFFQQAVAEEITLELKGTVSSFEPNFNLPIALGDVVVWQFTYETETLSAPGTDCGIFSLTYPASSGLFVRSTLTVGSKTLTLTPLNQAGSIILRDNCMDPFNPGKARDKIQGGIGNFFVPIFENVPGVTVSGVSDGVADYDVSGIGFFIRENTGLLVSGLTLPFAVPDPIVVQNSIQNFSVHLRAVVTSVGGSCCFFGFTSFNMNNLELTQPPLPMVERLFQMVIDLNLSKGITNSLDGKLRAALGVLDGTNENNDTAAIHSLNLFISAVEAQRGSSISDEEADSLVEFANRILVVINN